VERGARAVCAGSGADGVAVPRQKRRRGWWLEKAGIWHADIRRVACDGAGLGQRRGARRWGWAWVAKPRRGSALGALTRQAQRLAAEVKQQRRQASAAASALQRGLRLR
jgi:hypothetical protein